MTPELATSWLGLPFPAGPFVSIRRVVQVRLDGRRRTTETSGDLGDRQALLITLMARERGGPAALLDAVCARHRPATMTLVLDGYRTRWTFAPGEQGLDGGGWPTIAAHLFV